MVKANTLSYPQKAKFYLTASLPASAVAGTSGTFTIFQNSPANAGLNPAIVSSSEKWFILNISANETQNPDFIFGLLVNGNVQPYSVDANTTIPTNSGRVELSSAINGYADAIEVESSSNVAVSYYTLAANGSTAVTLTGFLDVLRVPVKA